MPLNKKRKSESVSVAEETTSPAKRAAPDNAVTPATPGTTEKRKRGRPRKYPEGSVPKRPDGPKRGRGRPRKDPSAKETPKSTTPKEGKRPVGRPRKYAAQNGSNDSTKLHSPNAKEDGEDKTVSYWLMKAEPESRLEKGVDVKFSIDDLRAAKEPEPWDGVRNPVASNNIRSMKKGDLAFFYHSNCKVPGIAGIMEIVQEHTPDESAFDPAHPYYDEKSSRENPKWVVVHVEFRSKLKNLITLTELKSHASPGGPLENLQILKQSRLSVSAVTPEQWEFIMGLAKESEDEDDSSKDDASAEEDESSE